MKKRYDADALKIMSLFEKITRAKLKDCFEMEEVLYFIIENGQIKKALGKESYNIKKLEKLLNRKFKIIEFSSNKLGFIKKAIFPLKVSNLEEDDQNNIVLSSENSKTKGLLIGRNAKNLRALERIARRYFDINEIKVV